MSENTAGLGNILNSLMENPEMLQKAMSIASSLASSGILDNLMNTPNDGGQPSPSGNPYQPSQSASPDLSSVGNLLSGMMNDKPKSPEHDAKGNKPPEQSKPQLSTNQQSDERASSHTPRVGHAERIRLLQSLRPFLPNDKQEKLDFVIKLLGLLEAAEQMGLGKLF